MSVQSNLISSSVIAQSGITFGTSGARGLVSQFTKDVCAAFSIAFIAGMQRNFSFTQVAIAIDNRPSSYAMAMSCAGALKQLNIDVVYYGVVPTPALAYIAQEDVIPAIMVTGSHIPFDRNGLKFYRPDGEISKADEQFIITDQVEFTELYVLPELIASNRAAEVYITRYTSLFDTPWLKGKRIGIYEHSSAGRDLYYRIFEKLGAEVIALERSTQFVPIDTEAVSEEDTAKAIKWSEEYSLDAVFSTDGDGDRPLMSDENGYWLRGDILCLLAAKSLDIEALAVPVSCNSAIEACGAFKKVARTQIGSPFVIAAFDGLQQHYSRVAGFEANGGFLLASDVEVNGIQLNALPTRDAVLPVLAVLLLAGEGTISSLVEHLPSIYTASGRIQNFSRNKSLQIIEKGLQQPLLLLSMFGLAELELSKIDVIDGLRMTLTNGEVVHLRPSGNASELRCYAESLSVERAKSLVDLVLSAIANFK